MKKSKLIELLTSIEGNPEIKLWNGLVDDWVDLRPEIVTIDLVKQTQEHWLEMIRIEACRDSRDWDYQLPAEEVARLKKEYNKVCQWEDNSYVTEEDITAGRYKVKAVKILQAKPKGAQSWDRMGTISY